MRKALKILIFITNCARIHSHKGGVRVIFEKARMIESDNKEKYVTMSVIKENGHEYAFANKFNNGEPTEEYSIFTIIDNEITIVKDNNLINKLLPIFQKEIANELELILDDNK